MQLTSSHFEDGQPIPPELAFARPHPSEHLTLSDNKSPQLSWSELPAGTASLVLICVDPDAPTVADDVNQEGRTLAPELPRGDFHHWVMVDIPATCCGLDAGSCGAGVVPHGKPDPAGPSGSRQGVNDYTAWFAGDDEMAGTWLGYDGPCPPWNDERLHHYHFRLYALDVDSLPVQGAFTAADVQAAMQGHVLASTELTGTYSNNPASLS
ncbi:MAG: phospholipid-binding protein [Planctomycetota bacterium]|nr:MAG: phospholipid-binding protein [Planctomycetota bacterium]